MKLLFFKLIFKALPISQPTNVLAHGTEKCSKYTVNEVLSGLKTGQCEFFSGQKLVANG